MVTERERREAAYREAAEAVVASIEDEDADLFKLLDRAVEADALGAAYRLTYFAARAVKEVARINDDEPSEVLDRLLWPRTSTSSTEFEDYRP